MVISFPPKGGTSDVISPHTLMTGIQLDCNKHCKLEFDDHCQVCDDTTNDMTPCTVRGICLHQAGIMQGGFKFVSLVVDKKISRPNNQFAKLLATNEVINE